MRFGNLALALTVGLLAGCGGSYSGVQAAAPGPQAHVVGVAPDSGEFTLYQATGYMENHDPHVEAVWTVNMSQGQRLGFHWVTDKVHEWDSRGAVHLVAFAGGQERDLGPLVDRDVKFAWGGAHADIAGYFSGHATWANSRFFVLQ